ncbi:uncharacterized protein LOC110009395 [Jatropha curcas]|uniref:uncharacterized protein LOC110009395 n=1 Tax=Jatropha curcas TaxID=180498 RepID=UPI0009D7717D|nr:uncharacterized protein LOC110009395 [Jatropha curcas]
MKLRTSTASGTKTASDTADKPKVFQVSASILRIGSWEYNSRNEGELVVKCYFGKKRLIWEVLEGSTKSKIEINWCDIIALKASCPDNEPGTLTIVLGRQPSFFSSRDPDHRRWYSTRDFTNGQASIHRQHFLQFQQGLLNEFQKLIQCDMHLKHLSQQPGMILDSPYFENQSFVSENQIQYTIQSVSDFQDQASPSASQSCSVKIGKGDVAGKTLVIKVHFEEAPPSSGSN